jgi:hypothetical protein
MQIFCQFLSHFRLLYLNNIYIYIYMDIYCFMFLILVENVERIFQALHHRQPKKDLFAASNETFVLFDDTSGVRREQRLKAE